MIFFKFNGKDSRDYGITVGKRPYRESSNIRLDTEEVEGLDGMFFSKLGYNTYVMDIMFYIEGKENLEPVQGWLQGPGVFERSDLEGKYLIVERQSPLVLQYITEDLYRGTTTFYVTDPHWYSKEVEWEEPWGVNLIKNGWDDFGPYGSGEKPIIITPEGITRLGKNTSTATIKLDDSWEVVSSDEAATTHAFLTQETQDKILNYPSDITVLLDIEVLKMGKRLPFSFYVNNGYVGINEEMEEGRNIYSLPYTLGGGRPIFHLRQPANTHLKVHRIIILEKEGVPYVEKTPLGNGLTRIQTWGGNIRQKLSWRVGRHDGKAVYTHSVYIKNLGSKMFYRVWNTTSKDLPIDKGEEVYINDVSGESWTFNIMGGVLTDHKNDNLDFIASDPVIVEGNQAPSWEANSIPRIVNKGNVRSKPLIRLEKGKERIADVTVGDVRFIYQFGENDKYVEIDCKTQEAKEGYRNMSKNLLIGYKFPTLEPGDNKVIINKGDAKIKFRRTDRWK